MYDLPYDSCIHPDDRRPGLGYDHSGSIFDDYGREDYDGEESKVDTDNGSIQYSIQSNDQMQLQESTMASPRPQLSDLEEIRRRADQLKQKFNMIGRYDDLLDMDSLYSQSNCGEAGNENNDISLFDSTYDTKDQTEELIGTVDHSEHSFGSLYSADSASDASSDDSHQKSKKREVRSTTSSESRFSLKKDPPATFYYPRRDKADEASLCSVSHGEIEDILEQLENDARKCLSNALEKDIPYLVTTPEQKALSERDVDSVQSFVTEDSDDYGFTNTASVHDELCRHEMESKSTEQEEHDAQRSFDVSSPVQSDSKEEEQQPQEEGIAWNSTQVELFLKEYNGSHQRNQTEVAKLESQIQDHIEVETNLKRRLRNVIQEGEKEHLELEQTKVLLGEARKLLDSQVQDCANLKGENTKLKEKNSDLAVWIQKCKSDAAEKEQKMKRERQQLKDSSMAMSLTLEYRLARFQSLVNDLQEHSKKLEQDHGTKIEEATEKLSKQKRITNKYKKKYEAVCEKRDTLKTEVKSQRKKIQALEKKLKKQKESDAVKIAELKKKLRINTKKKKTKKQVKKTDAV